MGRVQKTQAEITRTIKYVLAESSRWLLHRRRDTKKINIPVCNKKSKKGKKRKTKSRKQGTNASKKIVLKASPQQQIFPSLLQSRDGDLTTPSAIFFLLSSAAISSATTAAVEPPPRQQSNEKQAKLPGLGVVATQVPLISRTGTLLRRTRSTISSLHSSTAVSVPVLLRYRI